MFLFRFFGFVVFFFPKKNTTSLVSKQLHHRPPKIQQPSLWPSHQSGHSPHLIGFVVLQVCKITWYAMSSYHRFLLFSFITKTCCIIGGGYEALGGYQSVNHFHSLKALFVWNIFSMLLGSNQFCLCQKKLITHGSLNLATIHEKTTYDRFRVIG